VILVVTSDKVYENTEDGTPFVESDRLGGDDPYSASKACAEIVTASIRRSLFAGSGSVVATARAGNVIGGGDWSTDRLIPDMIRGIAGNNPVVLRNPSATRPWQHVFDVLDGYFRHVEALWNHADTPLALNFGPSREGCITVAEMVRKMEKALGLFVKLEAANTSALAEKKQLRLDAGLAARSLGWRPKLCIDATIEWTAAWYAAWMRGDAMRAFSMNQLERYQDIHS
jgi:CDP-glucose 4,6-dehydratase